MWDFRMYECQARAAAAVAWCMAASTLMRESLAQVSIEDMGEALKALADPVRLQMLRELCSAPPREKAICVCELASKVGSSQPNVSHHLKALKAQGLVSCKKDARFAYYSANRARIESILDSILRSLA